tara:strand:- start:2308 stop:2658 length:351 start_codon:yes stop_codon:yes gene_type:complete
MLDDHIFVSQRKEMTRKQALDDPQIAAAAWTRFRRIMLWMAAGGAACVAASLIFLRLWAGPMPIHMVIATILGVWLTFMLGTGLMALVFLSSGTGHDEQVIDRIKDEVPEHDQDAR